MAYQKRLFFLYSLFLFFLPQYLLSQSLSVSGRVKDTTVPYIHSNAVVSVLKQEDSTMVTFTRSNETGNFEIKNLSSGKYILLITYPKYADYVQKFDLTEKPGKDFNTIYLIPRARLMEEIIVNKTAIIIKGDTTEYRADSFRVKANATVEDLLKELPGIQVDKDGKITAQGKRVHRLLLDGEEFFSDDPTIATRNLRANAIEKVQIFDKKSDQSAFTGIDDGESTRTINLELKNDAKEGSFGKIAAAASDENYNTQAFINSFKKKKKLAAFSILSNSDKTGLDFNESMNYGFDNQGISIDEGSGTIFLQSGQEDDLGVENYAGEGLPESIKAGLHYSSRWNQDRNQSNGNYLYAKLSEEGLRNVFRQNILEDSIYYTHSNSTHYTDQERHSLSGLFETSLDASSTLRLTFNGYIGKFDKTAEYTSDVTGQSKKPLAKSIRNLSNNGENLLLNAQALYLKKFKKEGRTLSVSIRNQLTDFDKKGFLYNKSTYFPPASLYQEEELNQRKKNSENQSIFSFSTTITEALSSRSLLEVNYSFRKNYSKNQWLTFDKDIQNDYTLFRSDLSSHYIYIYNTHSAGLNYRFTEKQFYFSLGGNVSGTGVNQKNLFKDSTINYNYFNVTPRAVFNYKFNSYSTLNLKYSGSTIQPTIQQLQPVKDNNDPMNVIIGNSLLKQEFENELQITYTNYQVLNERYLFLSSFIVHTRNMITDSYNIDKSGRSVLQYINGKDAFAASLGGGYSLKLSGSDIRISLGPTLNFSRYYNEINGLDNISTTYAYALRMNARWQKPEVFELYSTVIPSYNLSKSSISKISNTSFGNYSFNTGGSIFLPGKFEAGTDLNITLREKINHFDFSKDLMIWDAWLEKKFLKKDVLSFRLSISDILDQNKGYSRLQHPFFYEEKNYLTLQRYWLIGLSYQFANSGKDKIKDGTIRL